jgi:hypothetical protein
MKVLCEFVRNDGKVKLELTEQAIEELEKKGIKVKRI